MQLAFLRFFESLPSALAVGLLLIPMLVGEDGKRFKPAVFFLAAIRAALGFLMLIATARAIIPAERPVDFSTLVTFTFGTVVGKAWVATEVIAILFAVLAAMRFVSNSPMLDRVTLGVGVLVLAVVSVTGHAIDDGLPLYTQLSFLLHTSAGLIWFGGLLGLVWWMYTAKDKPPQVAHELAEHWSTVAKIAMGLVVLSGVALAWENVASFPNMLATPYGRLLTIKLSALCAVLLLALSLVRYKSREAADRFDIAWYSRVGAIEASFGAALLFIAGWIAVITPASHENDLYWPLPFRPSWAATWGYKVIPYSPVWWWGVVGVVLVVAAAAAWFTPKFREWRKIAAPVSAAAGALCMLISLSVEAYPDTYNDPTEDYTAESIMRGQTHFAANCVACHGAGGEGNGPMGKDLKDAKGVVTPPADLTAPHVATHTIGDIFHWLTFGGQSGVMPAFAEQLQPDDRWDVINLLLVMSYTGQARFMGPKGMVPWMIAPDFALIDPEDKITKLAKLRGAPTLISFARCATVEEGKDVPKSLEIAADVVKATAINQVTVYDAKCPASLKAHEAAHPKAVESAYSIINRYPNEAYSVEIPEAHFLIDRSGYVRARFRHFVPGDGNVEQFKTLVTQYKAEPLVTISLHSH
jgi:copper transport protein